MSERTPEAVKKLRRSAVYLVITTDEESLIGEYAGREGRRLVFVTGPLSPLRIPEHKVVDVTRLA